MVLVAQSPISGRLGYALLWCLALLEVFVVVLILANARFGNFLAAVLLVVYTLFLVLSRQAKGCACFGGAMEFGGRFGMIVRNLVLIVLAVVAGRIGLPPLTAGTYVLVAFLMGFIVALDRFASLAIGGSDVEQLVRKRKERLRVQ